MPINPNIKKILNNLKQVRESKGITYAQLEARLNLGDGWIEAVEMGKIDPPFDLILSIIEIIDIQFSEILANLEFEYGQSLNRKINPIQNHENLILKFQYNDHDASYTLNNYDA